MAFPGSRILPVALKLGTLCATFALLLSGCASVLDEGGALAVAPYDIDDNGSIVIDARVNGQGPFAFALDTGASISVIFDGLSEELGLESIPGIVLKIHGILASGNFPLLSVNRLEVGTEVWVEPRIASLPNAAVGAGLDGMLGIDFLRRYAVGFSARERAVRLYPPHLVSDRKYRGWTAIPLVPEHIGEGHAAVYVLEIEVDGHRLPAIFDLGAGLNMLNWAAADSLGLDTLSSRDDDLLRGAIDSAPVAARFNADEVTIGRLRWRKEEFVVADLEICETLMSDGVPCALLGAGPFSQRDFIIDFARSRLLVKFATDELDRPRGGDTSR